MARPEAGDQALISGESGAVGAGLLHWLMQPEPAARTAAAKARALLKLGPQSTVLLISTEGATDPAVWEAVTGCAAPTDGRD